MLMWVTKKLLAYLSGGICGRGSINRSRPTSGDAHALSETSPVCLVIWSVWSTWFLLFIWFILSLWLVSFNQKPENRTTVFL
jgi:preprotein translocase subunit SecG